MGYRQGNQNFALASCPGLPWKELCLDDFSVIGSNDCLETRSVFETVAICNNDFSTIYVTPTL